MDEKTITTKQIWVGLFFVALITGGMIIADLVSKYVKDKDKIEQPPVVVETEIELPAEEPPIKNDKPVDYKKTVLLSEPFFPPQNIYTDKNIYNENIINLALIGEFDKIELKVNGTIDNDLRNFISLNINSVSGTLGGARKSANTLDLDKTTGIFTKNNPIDFTLDLMESTKLSTTKEEFLSSFESTKNVIVWEKIKPPAYSGKGTIAKLLIVPYTEKGKYGDNVSINSIELLYTCKGASSSCSAKICDKENNYTYGSECLKDLFEKEFGTTSWESYADYYK
jgi:hypothetical protein